MSQPENGQKHAPKGWIQKLYGLMAAGRYASEWLPEFLILYEMIAQEDGEDEAVDWVLRELSLTWRPSTVAHCMHIARIGYRAWRAYRRIARD